MRNETQALFSKFHAALIGELGASRHDQDVAQEFAIKTLTDAGLHADSTDILDDEIEGSVAEALLALAQLLVPQLYTSPDTCPECDES